MSEKLYKCQCCVQGHGCNCIVSEEIEQKEKNKLSKTRRKKDKRITKKELI